MCSKFVPGSTFFLHSVKQKWTLGYSANTAASQEPPPKPTCRTLPHSIERWLYLQAIYWLIKFLFHGRILYKMIPKENRLVWLNCTAHSSLIITPCLALSSLYAVATSLNFWPSFNLAIASITLECFSHKIWRTLWNCDFMWISQLSLNNNNNLYHYNDLYVFLSSACVKDKSEPVHFGSEIIINFVNRIIPHDGCSVWFWSFF